MANIEKEFRFYYPLELLDGWVNKFKQIKFKGKYYELTIMYDSPNPKRSFYSKDVDGRLRLRYSTPDKNNPSIHLRDRGLVTWKQRLQYGQDEAVRKEIEIEYSFDPKEGDSVQEIFEDVLRCKRMSSYERFRSFFDINGIQVTLDEFPYGLMIEFEFGDELEEKEVLNTIKSFGINISGASKLSCDDKYLELCKKNAVKALPDISFKDITMPKI